MVRTYSIAILLAALGASPACLAGEPPPAPTVRQTVDRAIGYIQTESAAWLNSRKCAACHHVPMALWALGEAGKRGYTVDKDFIANTVENAIGSQEKMMASGLLANPANPPDTRPMAQGVNIAAAFSAAVVPAVPELSAGQKESLRFITDDILKKQREDGSWEFFLSRPPINESQTTDAVWIIMALQADNGPDAPESRRVAIEKATAWLADATPPNHLQDKALGLLLASRAGKSREEMQATLNAVLALQREDGGWAQLPELSSDAFATGQTLYALALAGYATDDAAIQRGIDFLVSTQNEDGSWTMASRATPDGSPGSAKLLTPITCAAACWGTLGLARLVPNAP